MSGHELDTALLVDVYRYRRAVVRTCNAAYDDSFADIKTRNDNAVGVSTQDSRLYALQLAASNNPKAAVGLECSLGQYKAVLMLSLIHI